jgi:hypothetical protein
MDVGLSPCDAPRLASVDQKVATLCPNIHRSAAGDKVLRRRAAVNAGSMTERKKEHMENGLRDSHAHQKHAGEVGEVVRGQRRPETRPERGGRLKM